MAILRLGNEIRPVLLAFGRASLWTTHRNVTASGSGAGELAIAAEGTEALPETFTDHWALLVVKEGQPDDKQTGAAFPASAGGAMIPPVRASKTFGRPWLPRFLSLVFLLVCFALPQQAAAQNLDATVSIAAAESTVTEGGTFSFTVSLSAAVDEFVNLSWAAMGSGGNPVTGPGSDLRNGQVTTGLLSFAPGAPGSRTFTIDIRNDDLVENDETFTVTLTGNLPDGVGFGTNTAMATIADTTRVSIALAESTVTEGGTFSFRVSLSAAVDEAVTVTWTAAGSGGSPATVSGPGSDLRDGQTTTATMSFVAGR